MVGLDGGGMLQEGIAAGHPRDRQRLQLGIRQTAVAFALVLPDAVKHLHAAHEADQEAAFTVLGRLKQLGHPFGAVLVVPQGEESGAVEQPTAAHT